MTPDERKDLIRRGYDELWNKGNLDVCDEVFASHCSFHNPNFPVDGVAGLREFARELRTANPDLHLDVHDILVDGDMSAARWTLGGTASGDFRGVPATGKTYVMTGMTCDKWEGDRVVEQWTNYDMLGTLQQLGLIPETARQQTAE
ncbi:MAG: ester cyclase [Haloechinothrix sp.]